MSPQPVAPEPGDRRISVVVPCHNRAAYLDVLLRSLTWSAVPPSDFEVVVVNDGGVDHVELVADSWRRRGMPVRVLSLRAGGPPRNNAAARNAGARDAQFPILLQTDPDIVFVTDVLHLVQQQWAPGTFCSNSRYLPLTRQSTLDLAFGPDGPANSANAYLQRAIGRPNQVLAPDGVGGLHGGFACAKADFERIGGYDESFAHWGWEDRELLVTLEHDGGLRRCYMDGATVIHLWHPPLRGDAGREELAARGRVSQVAFDVQMQRASAEYARSRRPRPRRTLALRPDPARFAQRASGPPSFDPASYDDWSDRTQGLSGPSVPYQLFFDAWCFEARQLRAAGYASLCQDVLLEALERPWERRRLELACYDRVPFMLEELAECQSELGDVAAREQTLAALARCENGSALVSELRARAALRAGDLAGARRQSLSLRGTRWSPRRAALGIELAMLAGEPGSALHIMGAANADAARGDYFEQLRLVAYARLLGRLVPSAEAPVACTEFSRVADDRSEFLFSGAVRSRRLELDLAAYLLLDAFLRGGAPADDRLFMQGAQHRDRARDRIVRLVGSDAAGFLFEWGCDAA